LNEVQKVCDRVGIIRDGHLVEIEDVETLLHRGGKEVRVHVAEAVDTGDFAIDGAHDVESAGGEGSSTHPVETDSGDVRFDGGDVPEDDSGWGTSVSFTYTGRFDTLLSSLLDYTIIDLDIEDAPLEDVFMRFYGEDSGGETDV
jgi:ABC-2 type transport system ATP-binding protein